MHKPQFHPLRYIISLTCTSCRIEIFDNLYDGHYNGACVPAPQTDSDIVVALSLHLNRCLLSDLTNCDAPLTFIP